MTEIRSATSADAGILAELRWEFRTEKHTAAETHAAFVKRCAPWMRSELATGRSWRAWVASADRAIVGCVWLHVITKIPNPVGESERHAYLSNLYVKPAARGGTGTRLLEAVLGWSRANGIDRIVLWPSRQSVTLYLRHGFSHGGEVMELRVKS
jgi:GNAT superfamily N-acetyltransferase